MRSSYISCNISSSDELRPAVTTGGYAGGNFTPMTKRVGSGNGNATHYLREWRKGKGHSQETLAERAGTTKATISRTETGGQSLMPSALKLYADILGTHPSVILERPPRAEECVKPPPRGTAARSQRTHSRPSRRR